MLTIENAEVYGWEAAIRGARNPMNSWARMDSRHCANDGECLMVETGDDPADETCRNGEKGYCIGRKDWVLMQSLCKAGTEHRKFMRFITVTMDVTAPLYWWKEYETYRVGTVSNSCSTMHKIHAKPFTLEDFSTEHLSQASMTLLKSTIDMLNTWRNLYNATDDERKAYFEQNGHPAVLTKKDCWWQMIQLLPSSYNQRRTLLLNYEVLRNIYRQRKDHKLDEWHDFCDWIQTLPYSELITGDDADGQH